MGGLAETVVPGAKVGPTFMCIIAEQFRRTRAGDRFWYENPGVFSAAQLREIRQANLARVICDNADDISEVPRDVFRKHNYPQDYTQCTDDVIARVDLKIWASCCSGRRLMRVHRANPGHMTNFLLQGPPGPLV